MTGMVRLKKGKNAKGVAESDMLQETHEELSALSQGVEAEGDEEEGARADASPAKRAKPSKPSNTARDAAPVEVPVEPRTVTLAKNRAAVQESSDKDERLKALEREVKKLRRINSLSAPATPTNSSPGASKVKKC